MSNLKYSDLIYPLTKEIEVITKNFGNYTKYTELLNVFNATLAEEDKLPYQKDLLKMLRIKRADLVELMNNLYQDFQDLMSNKEAYTIQETEIQFIVTDEDQIWIVGPESLNIIPRIGETVYLPTLTRDHRGASYFKVKEIIHEISGGKHITEIHMS